jgi:uncharacterized protein with HEPN domain
MDWRDISDLRNYTVHSYWQIDLETVTDVAMHRLGGLIAEPDRLILLVERLER